MDPEALLEDLTATQRHAVSTESSRLCILAGAGSGKTRVLTRRVAFRVATGSATPQHVLALTFTRRAAGEMGERLRALGVRQRVTAGTFHAVAYAQLRQYWADRGQPAPALLDRKAHFLARLVADRPGARDAPLGELAAEIEWASARLVTPEEYPAAARSAGRHPPVDLRAMAELLGRYRSEKIRRRVIDFDDLLRHCAEAIESDPLFGAAQRWRWRHVFVDEFQDVNPLQFRLLSAWAGEACDLCVVGDPNQAVYGWNGADPDLLTRLPRRWPDTEVVRLDVNHRCTPQVVRAAAGVLGSAEDSTGSSRPDGPPVSVRAYPDGAAEARGIAAQMRDRHGGGFAWSDMAVLVRTNALLAALEAACRVEGVAYRLAGVNPLLEDPWIASALVELRRRRAEPFQVVLADLASTAREFARTPLSPPGVGGGTPAAGPDTLAALASEYRAMSSAPTVDGFLGWLGPATDPDRGDSAAVGVTLSTFHRAKGLEWRAVWVAGLEDGLVPIIHADTPRAEAEERRLLYVALTRASDELRCSWARERCFGDRPIPRFPSPWLEELSVSAGVVREGLERSPEPLPPAEEWRARLAEQRDLLNRTRRSGGRADRRGPRANADPAVVDALRAWRAGAARAAGVPAQVVLHDATLAAMALLRPSTEADLLGVPGMGAVKVARYGAILLEVVSQACA